MEQTIEIDDKDSLIQEYLLSKTGRDGRTTKIALPPIALKRECRRFGISEDEAVEKLKGTWYFNSFEGLHLVFKLKNAKTKEKKS